MVDTSFSKGQVSTKAGQLQVSGCFRTRKYAEAYCRISSYLQSMANQGYNPLVAIQIALAGRPVDNLPE